MTSGGVYYCILCFRITMDSFPLRNLLEKAKDDGERLTLEIIFMMSNVAPVGQGKNKRRRGTPIDRTEAAFNVFDSDKVFSLTNFNSPIKYSAICARADSGGGGGHYRRSHRVM